jgi:hypothetical protein
MPLCLFIAMELMLYTPVLLFHSGGGGAQVELSTFCVNLHSCACEIMQKTSHLGHLIDAIERSKRTVPYNTWNRQ